MSREGSDRADKLDRSAATNRIAHLASRKQDCFFAGGVPILGTMPQRRREDGRTDDGPRRLRRLLERPELARVAPHLAPEVVHRLIRHAGLEPCVDLVEASTREQLAAILDLDLWRAPRPGRDEELDADRFGHWVETLVDHDAATAARVIASFDRSLSVTALSRYIRVLDPGVLEPTESTDDERRE